MKKFFLLSLVILHLTLISVFSVSAESSDCAKVFKNNCAECHEIDRGCELLGQSQQEWKALFEFMEEMGADLPDDEKNLLTDCLSKPDDEVKKTCQN